MPIPNTILGRKSTFAHLFSKFSRFKMDLLSHSKLSHWPLLPVEWAHGIQGMKELEDVFVIISPATPLSLIY